MDILTEQEWLESRLAHIGASEVPALFGLGFMSAYELMAVKLGHVEPFSGNLATSIGLALEDIIAKEFTKKHGLELLDPGKYTVFPHHEWPVLRATPDRVIGDLEDPIAVVELKHVSERNVQDVRDGKAHDSHLVQLQTQMLCTGARKGYLAYVIGNSEYVDLEYDYDAEWGDMILDRAKWFWELKEAGEYPEPDAKSIEVLKKLHPKDSGEEITDDAMEYWISRRQAAKADQKALEQEIKECDAHLMDAMGDVTTLHAGNFQVTWKWQERKGYSVEPSETRVLRVKEVAGD